jgi:hypothetical protein
MMRERMLMQVSSNVSKKATLRILLASAAVAVGVIIFGIVEWQRAKAAENWPTVDGVVVSAEIKWHRSTRSDGSRSNRSYSPDITYRYQIYGDVYENNRVMFAQHSSNTESGIRPILDRYPEGSRVTVCYHPRKPELSVLEPGMTMGNYFIPLFGIVWLLGSLGFYWLLATYLPDGVEKVEEAQALTEPV